MIVRGAGRRRIWGMASLLAGSCALTVGIATLQAPGRVPASAGTLPAPVSTSADPSAPVSTSAGPPPSRVRVAPTTAPALLPTRLLIGKLSVDAPVQPAGVARDGELRIPEDPARLGWWIGSARPGEARGTVLIAGHVDTATDGRGALFRLETLPIGATIAVRSGTSTEQYRTVARRSYVKQRLPDDLFRTGTPPRLVLITCGGDFRDGAYSHNVVVYAEPVGG